MSVAQIIAEALTLSIDERASLARTLWESVGADDAVRRDTEISTGAVAGRSHDEVIHKAHLSLDPAKSAAAAPWREGLGAFVGEEEELARIQAVIDEEFGQIDPEDWK